jgi:hypothetical protein
MPALLAMIISDPARANAMRTVGPGTEKSAFPDWYPDAFAIAVYRPGLGTVVRCRLCDSVLMVFVSLHGTTCTDLMGLASLS